MNFISKMSDKTIKIILYVLFAAATIYSSMQLLVPGVLDEIGTISNTAHLAGDDWIRCIQSMGGFYYKYGQVIFYYPFYILLRDDPYLIYPVLVSVQMVFVSFIPVIAYHIARVYLKIDSKVSALLIALGGSGISSIWLYAEYTRGEFMLIFLPWVLSLLFLKLSTLEDETDSKQRKIYSVLLSLVSVYAYMAHSRGIVLVIATVMTVFFISVFVKKHIVNYWFYIPSTALFLLIDKMLTRYFKHATFANYEPRHGGFDSFDVDTFVNIFTFKGFLIYGKLATGWIFNLCASTMGLVILGFAATLYLTLRLIFKKKQKNEFSTQATILSVFALVVLLGVFFMGSLFFYPSVYNLFYGIKVTRADRAVFGRYTVSAVGPICFLALYFLIEKKDTLIRWKTKILSILFFITIIVGFKFFVGPSLDDVGRTNARYFLSLTAFLKIEDGHTSASFPDLNDTLVFTAIVSLCIFLVILALSCAKKKKLLLTIAGIVFTISVVNYTYVFSNVRIAHDRYIYGSVNEVVTQISDINHKAHVSTKYNGVYVASEGSVKYYQIDSNGKPFKNTSKDVKHYQLLLPRFDFSRLPFLQDTKDQKEFFIICRKSAIHNAANYVKEQYPDAEFYTIDNFDYKNAARDVVFIQGKNLAKEVEAAGFSVTPFKYKKIEL